MESAVQSVMIALEKSKKQMDNIIWRLNTLELTVYNESDIPLMDMLGDTKSMKCEYKKLLQEIIDLDGQEAKLKSEIRKVVTKIKKKIFIMNKTLAVSGIQTQTMYCDMEYLKSKEEKWLSSLMEAIRVRDDNLTTLKNDLNVKVELISEQDKEISQLKENIFEITRSLKSECRLREDEKSHYEDELRRQKQEVCAESQIAINKEWTLSKTKLEELKTKNAFTIMEMARGMKKELEELELQLEKEKSFSEEKKIEYKKLQNDLIEKGKKLNAVNIKLTNNKKEITSLKSICDQSIYEKKKLIVKLKIVMEENEKLLKENSDLKNTNMLTSKDTVDKLEYIISTLKINQEKEVVLLDKLQKFADEKLQFDTKNIQLGQAKIYNNVIIQTDDFENQCISDLTSQLMVIKSREEMLQHNMTLIEKEMKDVNKQNSMLKEVIRDMKKDREHKIRQIEQEEDESRVKRLEERVKVLKDSLLQNNTNGNVWVTLDKFKDELNLLKGRKWHRVTKHNIVEGSNHQEEDLFIGDKELIQKSAKQETRPNKSILKRS